MVFKAQNELSENFISLQLKPLTLSHCDHLQLSQHGPELEHLLEALLSVLCAPYMEKGGKISQYTQTLNYPIQVLTFESRELFYFLKTK